MKVQIILLISMVFGSTGFAGTKGGGSGCMGEIMATALGVSKLIDSASKNLPVTGDNFLAQVDPHVFHFTQDDLMYEGNHVDAFYNGNKIQVRCDRLEANTPEGRERAVAHEIFRKMTLEGDRYEISRQIPGLWSPLASGNYRDLASPFQRVYLDVELGPASNQLTITVSRPKEPSYSWGPLIYTCTGNQCRGHSDFYRPDGYFHEDIVLSILQDGNFVWHFTGTYDFDGKTSELMPTSEKYKSLAKPTSWRSH